MMVSLKKLFILVLAGFLMHSCSNNPITYQPTMMHIPNASKKGDVSITSTVGARHAELQGAFAPVDRLVIQTAFITENAGRQEVEKQNNSE
jgi:hypothetical protein